MQAARRRLSAASGFTAFALGILSTLAFQLLLDYTHIYRTRIRPDLRHAPIQIMEDSQQFPNEAALIFRLETVVENHGLRPGHLSHVEVAPASLQPMPKTEVISFDRETLWPWQPRVVVTRVLVHLIQPAVTTWEVQYFDDTGALAFSHDFHQFTKP